MSETTEAVSATGRTRKVGPIVVVCREAHAWVEKSDATFPDSDSAAKWIKEKASPGTYKILRQISQIEVTERQETVRNCIEN